MDVGTGSAFVGVWLDNRAREELDDLAWRKRASRSAELRAAIGRHLAAERGEDGTERLAEEAKTSK